MSVGGIDEANRLIDSYLQEIDRQNAEAAEQAANAAETQARNQQNNDNDTTTDSETTNDRAADGD